MDGCGGGVLRFLVPELTLPTLRDAAAEHLQSEEGWAIESATVPCQSCGGPADVCGYVVARAGHLEGGRGGIRLRMRSTVARATTRWALVDTERILDEARLEGLLSYREARHLIDWAHQEQAHLGPVESAAKAPVSSFDVWPPAATHRLRRIAMVEEKAVLFRLWYLRRTQAGYVLVEEGRERIEGALTPPVREGVWAEPSPL